MFHVVPQCAKLKPFLLNAPSIPCRLTPIVLHYNHQPSCIPYQPIQTLHYFDHHLQQCKTVPHCRQIHAHISVTGALRYGFFVSRILSLYSRFGLIVCAQKLFNTSPMECVSNLLLWNSMIRANISNGYFVEGLGDYIRMREFEVFGDGFTFPMIIKACGCIGKPDLCKIVHCLALQTGFRNHVHVGNELVEMYKKIGRTWDARKVFDRMSVKTHISWNTMVSCYALNYDCDGANEVFKQMELQGFQPNIVTWTSLLSSYARCGDHEETMNLFDNMIVTGIRASGEILALMLSVFSDQCLFDRSKMIHSYVVKSGFGNHLSVKNALISMYGKHKDLQTARNLFMEMETKNIVSWNSFITSYAESGLCDEAFDLFLSMEKQEVRPNVVTWSALIKAFALQGRNESLEIFRRMNNAKVRANSVTISIILSVLADLAVLRVGREIHAHVIRFQSDNNILVDNSLVNMYAKCGCLNEAKSIFEKIADKDIVSWNAIITGYAMHGDGRIALTIFDQMIESGCKPDEVSFIAVLSGCSHSGLVMEGRKLFNEMKSEYDIEPQMEHYACLVDLFGRARLLDEARETINNMPMAPNACVLGAFLHSHRLKGKSENAEETVLPVYGFESLSTGSYMLLSNMYAENGRWEDSARVRISARSKGLKKNPGHSWIEIKKKVFTFSAGTNACTGGLERVYEIVEELALQIENKDYQFFFSISY